MNILSKLCPKLSLISIAAGIIYNSWPLGLIVNPIIAKHGQASQLAATNQPYNWVFRYGDVVSGLLMVFICFILVVNDRKAIDTYRLKLSLLLIIGFAVFASIAAVVPVQCLSALRECPSFIHNKITLVHAITSVIGPSCLYLSMLMFWKNGQNRFLNIQLIIFGIAGLITFILQFVPGSDVIVQDIFICICLAAMALYPYNFSRALDSAK
jgi:hypothetical protein